MPTDQLAMSSEDEDEQFIGDEHGVYEGGEVVADLMGDDMQQDGTETSDDDNDGGVPQNVLPDHDDSIHTFDGHRGTSKIPLLPANYWA